MALRDVSFYSKTSCPLVAAIDFGQTYSGYAYSLKHEHDLNPSNIHTNTWAAGPTGLFSIRTATCVLFDPTGQFDRFGFEAEDKYLVDLSIDGEASQWYFFTKFKMANHIKKTDETFMLQDVTGKTMPAITVYSSAIRYLSEHCLESIGYKWAVLRSSDVHWVITVPTIWSCSQIRLMRTAAIMAGIDHDRLTLVTEHEAAALWCQHVSPNTFQTPDSPTLCSTRKLLKYMVVDAKGESTDITVFESQMYGRALEVYKTCGQAFGGNLVNNEFMGLLIKLFGASVYAEFCKEYSEDNFDLQRELETKKRCFKQASTGKVTVRIPISYAEVLTRSTGKTMKELITDSQYKDKVFAFHTDKLRMLPEVFSELFKPSIDSIVSHIGQVRRNELVKDANILLLVGGFAGSDLVQTAIRAAFPQVEVFVPEEPDLCLLKGAIAYGHWIVEPGMVLVVQKNELVKDANILLLVGGFAGSDLVQTAIRVAFPQVEVLVPGEPDLCLLRGAVAYGHWVLEPDMVSVGA